MRRSAFVLLLCVALAAPRRALAQPSDNGTAAAESLFQEGRKLMEQKRYADACPKFLASHKLSPAHGTLLNLADCYEKNGQIASAWARFHEAIALAQRLHREDREKTARERADRLEPRLIRLTIDAREKDIDVKLDGLPLDSAVLGTPVPVDPGKHTIDASAKNKKPWSTTIDVSEKNKSPSVEIPALEDDASAAPAPTAPPPAGGETTIEPPSNGESGGGGQKTLGMALAGVGALGVGVGVYFGIDTSSKWKDAKTHCNASYECDQTGVDLTNQAKSSATISTVAVVAGTALLVGGAVLFFTAPKHDARSVGLGVGLGTLHLRGSF